MTDAYNQFGPPPSDFPDLFPKMETPGEHLVGVVQAVRAYPDPVTNERKPVLDLIISESPHHPEQVGQLRSVICGARSLWSLVLSVQPVPGETVRISFDSFAGQAKNFSLTKAGAVAPVAAAPAPAVAPVAPAPAVAPAVAPIAPAPAVAPIAPAPAVAPVTPPWGQG